MTSLRRSLFLTLSLVFLYHPLAAQTLRIYHIDVEQADAALIVMPNGRTVLIDSGKNGHGQRIRAVMPQAGVTKIDDAFVNFHYHEDHFGGIDEIFGSNNGDFRRGQTASSRWAGMRVNSTTSV